MWTSESTKALLFLCYINDLPESVTSKVRLFTDDCLLYREINSFDDHLKLQTDLKQLEVWASKWGMRFDASKCYILSIWKNSTKKSLFHYQLNNTILKHVTENLYLEILFSYVVTILIIFLIYDFTLKSNSRAVYACLVFIGFLGLIVSNFNSANLYIAFSI